MASAKKTKKLVSKSKAKANTFDVRKKAFLNWLKQPANFFVFVIILVVVLFVGNFLLDRTIGYFERKNLEANHQKLLDLTMDKILINDQAGFKTDRYCKYLSGFKYEDRDVECTISTTKLIKIGNVDEFKRILNDFSASASIKFSEIDTLSLLQGDREYLSASLDNKSIDENCNLYISVEDGDLEFEAKCSKLRPSYSFYEF